MGRVIAAGLLGLLLAPAPGSARAGEGKPAPQARRGRDSSRRPSDVPGRGKPKVQVGGLSEMNWSYGTLALFQRGGAEWDSRFGAAKTALLGHQKKEGCARGSRDPEGQYEHAVGGRILSTALGVLILEEPVRHRRLAP